MINFYIYGIYDKLQCVILIYMNETLKNQWIKEALIMKCKSCIIVIAVLFGVISCTTYKTQYTGFKHAAKYHNSVTVSGVTIGAEAFADQAAAREAFGFDIKKAGLLPVQVVLDNQGGSNFEVVGNQTFLVDNNNLYWNLIPNKVAVRRVAKATESGAILAGAGKGAGWGTASGAVLGAAYGVVDGKNVAETAGKGAVAGAASGAVYGGRKGGTDPGRERIIAEDIRDKGLEGKSIPDQGLANGFLFFPAEAQSAQDIRLQMRNMQTGEIYKVLLSF